MAEERLTEERLTVRLSTVDAANVTTLGNALRDPKRRARVTRAETLRAALSIAVGTLGQTEAHQ